MLAAALAAAMVSTAPSALATPLKAAGGTPDAVSAGEADRCGISPEPGRFEDDSGSATLTVTDVDDNCLRTYRLVSSMAGEHTFSERPGKPTLRTGSALLDGLYALAHDEAELNKTDQVSNGDYNDGNPVPCGGCYITGKSWTYVWTRDVSYSADLGLTPVDPERMRNTLAFKLSDRRDGSGGTQIIQDTGTGGSYPSSTDRVVWALGAEEIINWLPDGEREKFSAQAYDAIRNTIEHDRKVAFDQKDRLYLGEHSFLDWREQSYAQYVKDDVTYVATSRSLSTNVAHWAAIDAASRLARAAGDRASAAKYRTWADELLKSIREKYWLPEKGQFSQMLSSELDRAKVNRYDALGTALAVLTGVATPEQAKEAVKNYPQTEYGPPVLAPQQQNTPSYHNNGIWPFVTAYMMRAAAKTGNDSAAARQARSLVRAAALYGTNKENMNLLTGGTDTEINSDRQLWSVAGMMSMVQQTIFGIDAQDDGLHIAPFLPAQLRKAYFPDGDRAELDGMRYRGRSLDISLDLPEDRTDKGAFTVESLTLDGKRLRAGEPITERMLGAEGSTSKLVVKLGKPKPGSSVPAPGLVDRSDKEALYGPKTPVLRSVTPTADPQGMRLGLDIGDEDPSKVTMDVLRDGEVIAKDLHLRGSTPNWVDTTATDRDTVSYCYSVRLTYTSSGNTSQHAEPKCYWGPDDNRVHKVTGEDFEAVGGTKAGNDNGVYYAGWGTDPKDKLTARVAPKTSGDYLLQVDAAVGGPINTGVSGGVKMLRVYDDETGELVTQDVIHMPHTGSWSEVRGSTYASAHLTGGKTYRLELVHDPLAVNMSYFSANATYKDTRNGPVNYADVFAMKAMLKEKTDS